MKTWFITGTSTGLGHALAEEVIASGHTLIATARNKEKIADLAAKAPERVLTVDLEVTDGASIKAAVADGMARFGRIDVLVNNAGYGLTGAIEEISLEEARQQYEVNVFGLLAVTQEILPIMRQQQVGHILNISSQGGFVATPGLGIYASTKFAVEAISEALAAEVKAFGIRVTSIQPGPFRTEWAGSNMLHPAHIMPEYEATAGALRRTFQTINGKQPGDPAKAAKLMMQVVASEQPPLRLPLGRVAIDRIRAKLAEVEAEIKAWEELAKATSFSSAS